MALHSFSDTRIFVQNVGLERMYNGYSLVVYDTNIVIDIFDKSKAKNRINKEDRKKLKKITTQLFKQNKVFITPLNRLEYLNLTNNKIYLPELDLEYIPREEKNKYLKELSKLYQKKLKENFLEIDDKMDLATIASLIVYVMQKNVKILYLTHDKVLNDPEVYGYIYQETEGRLEIHDLDTFIPLFRSLYER